MCINNHLFIEVMFVHHSSHLSLNDWSRNLVLFLHRLRADIIKYNVSKDKNV